MTMRCEVKSLPKEKFFDPRKPFQSQRPETHEEWQARMGGEVLAVVRSGLYLDFRFLDMALSALSPAPDERCRVLATDGQTLYYQPQRLLQLYQENPKYLNRLYLHTVFHCVFRHLWLKGRREPQLWSLACDIAVENVIDSLQRKSVIRPLTYVRQNAYRQITAEEKVVAAAPVYRWLTRQTPGVLRQLEREFVTDDHRLWPKDAPEQPQQMPTPLPQKTWQKIGERMQTELDLRDKEAGDGADAAVEGDAADDAACNGVELVVDAGRGADGLDTSALKEGGDAVHQAGVQEHTHDGLRDGDAGDLSSLGVAADGEHVLAEAGLVPHDPGHNAQQQEDDDQVRELEAEDIDRAGRQADIAGVQGGQGLRGAGGLVLDVDAAQTVGDQLRAQGDDEGVHVELGHAEAVERGDDDRDRHADEERQDQGQRLSDAGIVSRRERDRLQHGGCDSRAEAEHTADGQVGTGKDDDARDAVGQNALRGSLLQDGDQVADGEEVRLDGNDDNKEQKQDDVQRVLEQHILQLLRVHFLRIRHFLNLFIHIAQPDA